VDTHFIVFIQNSKNNMSQSITTCLIWPQLTSYPRCVHKVMGVGLNLITLPLHISHALQPFDVSCFKPFKTTFKVYRNVWA
jgi:hypothetical protein